MQMPSRKTKTLKLPKAPNWYKLPKEFLQKKIGIIGILTSDIKKGYKMTKEK